jgi:hypothetical protein
MSLWPLIGPYSLPFFLIAMVLSWRWLSLYAAAATIVLALLWQNHMAHQHEGNGFAVAMAEATLYFATIALVAGVLVRALVLILRARGVKRRFAYLPMPLALALILLWPSLASWYGEFKRRPPADECHAATHQVDLAGTSFHVPMAPVFTIFQEINPGAIYSLESNIGARKFCDRVANESSMPIRILMLDFARSLPRDNRPWPAQVCETPRRRDWMRQFCVGPMDEVPAGHPRDVKFVATDARKGIVPSDMIALLDEPAATESRSGPYPDTSVWRLDGADGKPIAVRCRPFSEAQTSCIAVYEPTSTVSASLQFVAGRETVPADTIAIQTTIQAIFNDLRQP